MFLFYYYFPVDFVAFKPFVGTHYEVGSISHRVVKLNAQGEVDLFGAERAGLFDVKLVPILLKSELQVVMLTQLAFHHVDTWRMFKMHVFKFKISQVVNLLNVQCILSS